MPNKDVTRIPSILALLMESFGERKVYDPFNATEDEWYAPDVIQHVSQGSQEGVLLRPPTTWTQVMCYVKRHNKTWDGTTRWWSSIKDGVSRITQMGGVVVSVGWDSNGLGTKRGFQMERILMVNHGGHWRDTIVTVERKVADVFPTVTDDEAVISL
jgi:hypothetical protein